MWFKVRNKLKNLIRSRRLILKTRFNKLFKISDVTRWEKPKALFHDWDERTALLAAHIPKNSRVLEFGAARLSLKAMLPEGCAYFHSDIVQRAEGTLVADLNKSFPDIPNVDIIVFSGVLEYVAKVPELLEWLKDKTRIILFSYAVTDTYPVISTRRKHGWISDHSEVDFIQWAKKYSFKTQNIGQWRRQYLFLWQKNPK